MLTIKVSEKDQDGKYLTLEIPDKFIFTINFDAFNHDYLDINTQKFTFSCNVRGNHSDKDEILQLMEIAKELRGRKINHFGIGPIVIERTMYIDFHFPNIDDYDFHNTPLDFTMMLKEKPH